MISKDWLKNWKLKGEIEAMVKSMTPLGDHHVGPTAVEILERQRAGVSQTKLINDMVEKLMLKDSEIQRIYGQSNAHPNGNYEAAVYSRLAVLGDTRRFDLMSIYRNKENKFFVFVVVNEKWVVLEDDALFPSDTLITALRCLKL